MRCIVEFPTTYSGPNFLLTFSCPSLFAAQDLHRINAERFAGWEVTGENGNDTQKEGDGDSGYSIESSKIRKSAGQNSIQSQRSDETESDTPKYQCHRPMHNQRQDFGTLSP